jgi:hypothetical protein
MVETWIKVIEIRERFIQGCFIPLTNLDCATNPSFLDTICSG